jgi:hypothetical protein
VVNARGGVPPQGWNQRLPPGVARCACRDRRFYWAHLDPRAGRPCCTAPCCRAPHAAIVSTRAQIVALRAQTRDWPCPRCGQAIGLHQRNFECLDALTRAVRDFRARYGRG